MVRGDTNYIGPLIKNARNSRKMTQVQLAEKIDVTERYICAIENENKIPKLDLLFRIFRELNVPANDIVYPDRTPEDSRIGYITQLLQKCSDREVDAAIALLESLVASSK